MRSWLPLLLSLLTAPLVHAGTLSGIVVRAERGQVYVDLGQDSGIRIGRRLRFYREGAELKHPVSGESLGPIEETLAYGTISSVSEKYSIAALDSDPKEWTLPVTTIFRTLEEEAPAPMQAAPTAPAPVELHTTYYRSPLIDLLAVDIAIGDVDADGKEDIVLASQEEVRAYPAILGSARWVPLCTDTLEATGSKFLSLEAADLDGDGKAEVFATYYSSFFKRVETKVLICEKGSFRTVGSIPYMVRSFQDPSGNWTIGAQQLVADKSFPLSSIHGLEYREGKYRTKKEAVKHKRLEWLYGFGFANRADPAVDGSPASPFLLFYNHVGRFRAQFKKGAWTSKIKYGQTSERITWHDNTLHFFPRFVIAQGTSGLQGVYTVKNVAGMFNLASAFGRYTSSELHFLRWNGMSFEPSWKTELSGYAAGLALYGSGPEASLVIPVRGVEDSTSVWFYKK